MERILKNLPAHFFRFGKDSSGKIIALYSEGVIAAENDITTDKIEGIQLEKLFGKENYLYIKQFYDNAFNGEKVSFESFLRGKWFKTILIPYKILSDGKVTEIIGYSTDISEQKKTEEKHRKSKENLRTILNSISDAVIAVDLSGKITKMNPIAEKLTGYSENEVLDKPLAKIFKITNSITGETVDSPIQQVLDKGEIVKLTEDTMLVSKNGNKYHIDDSAAPINDKEGNITGVVLIFRDVTKEYKVKKELRENEKLFKTAGKASYDLVYEWNLSKDEVKWFGDIDGLLGYDKGEISENIEAWIGLIHPEDKKKIKDTIEFHRESAGPIKYEYRIKQKNGNYRYWSDNALPILNEKGKPYKWIGVCKDISERKNAENALRKSEAKYRALFEGINDAVFVHKLRKEGFSNFIEVNKIACKRLGYSREELLNLSPDDISLPEDAGSRESFKGKKNLLRNKWTVFEAVHVTKEGKRIPVEISSRIFELEDQPVIMYLARDITERKKAERALKESEDRLSKIMIAANDGMWDWDLKTDKVYFDQRYYKMAGYKVNEFPHQFEEFRKRVHPDDLSKVMDHARKHLKGVIDRFVVEFRFRKKDESYMWILGRGVIVERDKEGKPIRFVGTHTDITERKRAEVALRESEERFRKMAEMLPEAIFETNMNLKITYSNKRALSLFGYTKEELSEGLNGINMIAPEDRNRLLENFEKRKRGEDIGLLEYKGIRKNGSKFPVLFHISSIFKDKKLIGFRGLIIDIEKRKRLEEQLHQIRKVESIGRLAGGIAHDLNNLLAPILGYSEMLKEELKIDDKCKNIAGKILNAGLKARDLVRQLLAFSRKQTLKFKPMDLNRIIKDLKELLHRTIREDIKIKFNLSTDIIMVKADSSQIEQVIMNLASNASDAMPEGGKIIIETNHNPVEFDEEYAANHRGVKPGKYVQLSISDTGCGMDKETLEKIFEPFFSTKGENGTGLGLATVYGIIKQHDGNIWVYSEPGKGTTFKIYLPFVENSFVEEKIDKKKTTNLKGSETIIIVEDDENVRSMTRKILEQHGYNIIEKENGVGVLNELKKRDSKIHLLLTDVVMPEMNGKDLFIKASKLHPELKVLYMSGYTTNVIADKGVLKKGIQFIQKPFTMNKLASKVREVLDN